MQNGTDILHFHAEIGRDPLLHSGVRKKSCEFVTLWILNLSRVLVHQRFRRVVTVHVAELMRTVQLIMCLCYRFTCCCHSAWSAASCVLHRFHYRCHLHRRFQEKTQKYVNTSLPTIFYIAV